ncbi:MAG: lipopolysaccharide exporter, partial [Acetobacteraceae bacterium]|nr:lipopolysaccharide exporter [Acetobacteraceae bacterium]
AVAVLLEQVFTVATALRRFRVGVGTMIRQVWRPSLSACAMAAALASCGLGWSDDPSPLGLITAVITGTAIYAAVLLLSWLLAGRPAGAETDILALLRRAAH